MSEYSPENIKYAKGVVKYFNRLLALIGVLIIFIITQLVNPDFLKPQSEVEFTQLVEEVDAENLIENGIHVSSGLIVDEGYELVMNTCSGCHSLKLVTQNKGNKADWKEVIVWMQETQKLWDLGPTEGPIIAYLAKNYGQSKKGRRMNLENIEWYELE